MGRGGGRGEEASSSSPAAGGPREEHRLAGEETEGTDRFRRFCMGPFTILDFSYSGDLFYLNPLEVTQYFGVLRI